VLLQPLHQRQVIGAAAEQRHRRVGVGVDQPWRDQAAAPVEPIDCALLHPRPVGAVDADVGDHAIGAVDRNVSPAQDGVVDHQRTQPVDPIAMRDERN
jgi:hypothetical protein